MNPQPFTFGSLFAGIGGMDLGLERSGMTCAWQVEIDPFARRVLEKHWPDVRRHDDVRSFPDGNPDDFCVDLIAGGFPCQDLSEGGGQTGITGERSGLFAEIIRVADLLRPRFVLMENVSAILDRTEWLGTVLAALAEIGLDAEWECLPASAFGFDHRRDRTFILAYPHGEPREFFRHPPGNPRCPIGRGQGDPETEQHGWGGDIGRRRVDAFRRAAESGVRPVADGLPTRMDGYRGYGNAVVPTVAEWIGRKILEACR